MLNVLFIGGTGVISSACSQLALDRGLDLTLLNRGQSSRVHPPDAKTLTADIRDPESVHAAINGHHFDIVVDWIAFTPEHIETDLDLFRGRTDQYIFISSASAYQTPPRHLPVTESTPLHNPYWAYSRKKITCEERLMVATIPFEQGAREIMAWYDADPSRRVVDETLDSTMDTILQAYESVRS